MHFGSFVSNQSVAWWYTSPKENFEYGYPHSNAFQQFRLKSERCLPHNAHVIQQNVTYFRRIAGYTVPKFWRYPIRCHVTKASALEYFCVFWQDNKNYSCLEEMVPVLSWADKHVVPVLSVKEETDQVGTKRSAPSEGQEMAVYVIQVNTHYSVSILLNKSLARIHKD